MRFHFLVLSTCLMLAWHPGVNAQVYAADLAASEWASVNSDAGCSLTHLIPGFGKAVFSRKPKGDTAFQLEQTTNKILPAGTVVFATLPPVWRNNIAPITLGEAMSTTGKIPVTLNGKQATALLEQLANGVNVMLTAPAGAASNQSSSQADKAMRVILEMKNFAAAYKTYQACIGVSTDNPSPKTSSPTGNPGASAAVPVTAADAARLAGYIKRDSSLALSSTNSHVTNSASSEMYVADDTVTEWKHNGTPFSCNLGYDIPHFGKAVFAQNAGNKETFSVVADDVSNRLAGNIDIETLPKSWRADIAPALLAKITMRPEDQQIGLTPSQQDAVITQLMAGTRVMFTVQQKLGAAGDIPPASAGVKRIVLGVKNFPLAYKNYQQCINNLIPYSFSQVARTLILFPEKAEALQAPDKTTLGKVARYMKADPKVLGILIDAHSDNAGTAEANDASAKQEADWVTAYLIEQGIAADKITTRAHGDKYPVADNKTAAGRAQNRRVTVRLETAETRRVIEKKIAEMKASVEKAEAEKIAQQEKNPSPPAAEKKTVEKSGITAPTSADNKSSAQPGTDTKSSQGKMTPEEIKKLVEGLELIDK